MISVGNVGGGASGTAAYYAGDNYYTAGEGVEQSAWMGAGAALLGLFGKVDGAAFERVLAGQLPDGSVIKAPKGDLRPGLDMTFSVSKSVSLVAMLGGDQRVVEAVRQSVAATLGWVEKNLAEGRVVRDSKQVPERSGNLLAATFMHDVSRENEPQLHVHAVLANATKTADGKWRALHNVELFRRQHVMGTVFNTDLRARVEALGYVTERARNPRDGSFEITGVGRASADAFSTRSAAIDAYLKERGLQGTPRERELAALATRAAKEPTLAPEQRAEGWRALAAERGLDAGKLVDAALERAGRGETVWGQVMAGLRGVGERGLAVAASMGLTPRDGDPLVPERLGHLEPRAYAAAQAVASAVRDLGEREAAFDRLDLVRAALERGGPVTVGDVEARMALLQGKGLLKGDGDRMVTTLGAVVLEQAYLDQVKSGVGRSAPIVAERDAGVRAQDAARELGLNRLNPGQQGAAVLMLSSSDRVVNVQGGAGRGKSAALAPVVAIAKAEGRNVVGLAVSHGTKTKLGKDTGAAVSTIAAFLSRHGRVIDETAGPAQLARVREELAGAMIIVEEASQVGTAQMERLVRLANIVDAARLVQTGDARQLGAIDAGRPYAQSQAAGVATAHVTENLRSKSEQMIAVTAALDRSDVPAAFKVLKEGMFEVLDTQVATTAARLWAALPREERDQTLLLASGRTMRSDANAAAQAELKAAGEISAKGVRLDVLDRASVTREGARGVEHYREGRVVDFRTNLPSQRLERGDRGVVTGVDGERVRLRLQSGQERVFRPGKLPKNLKHDAVTISSVKQVKLHVGDRIRWTDTDAKRGLNNADLGTVQQVGGGKLVVSSLADGAVHELGRGDRMLERLDLAYAINVHVAQGITTEHGILALNSNERKLLSEPLFLVALTRVADRATLVLDDARQVERAVMRNPGEKTSALDVVERGKSGDAARLPHVRSPIDLTIERYAERFAEAEKARENGRDLSPRQEHDLVQAGDALDRVRPKGAEDLEIVLDRNPELARHMAEGRMGEVRQAWVEEGRTRADPGAYADRLVADWKATVAERGAAEGWRAEEKAERRMERLTERMEREPMLERTLDKRVPDRQQQIEQAGMGPKSRDRDMDMDMGM